MRVILEVIRSSEDIDIVYYREQCINLFKDYVSEYKWYPLTPTVHKLLINSPYIIENYGVPIGDLTEEALEASHKHFRSYRDSYARKLSRVANIKDVFSRLWTTSDPVINSQSKIKNLAREHSEAKKFFVNKVE